MNSDLAFKPKLSASGKDRAISTAARMLAVAVFSGLLGISFVHTGCSHSHSSASRQDQRIIHPLSPTEAAELAAKLANDKCEALFKRRPFTAGQHRATLVEGEYRWGDLDVGAPAGYSARVSFAPDGRHPNVEVFFSTDELLLVR